MSSAASPSAIVDRYMAGVRSPSSVTPDLAVKIEGEINRSLLAARRKAEKMALLAAKSAVPDRPNDRNAPKPDPEFPEGVANPGRASMNSSAPVSGVRQAVVTQRRLMAPNPEPVAASQERIPKPLINPFPVIADAISAPRFQPEDEMDSATDQESGEQALNEVMNDPIPVAFGGSPEQNPEVKVRKVASTNRPQVTKVTPQAIEKKRPFQKLFQRKRNQEGPLKKLFKPKSPKPVSVTK